MAAIVCMMNCVKMLDVYENIFVVVGSLTIKYDRLKPFICQTIICAIERCGVWSTYE